MCSDPGSKARGVPPSVLIRKTGTSQMRKLRPRLVMSLAHSRTAGKWHGASVPGTGTAEPAVSPAGRRSCQPGGVAVLRRREQADWSRLRCPPRSPLWGAPQLSEQGYEKGREAAYCRG